MGVSMDYYKDKETDTVWAFDNEQMAVVNRINTADFDAEKIPEIFFEINEKIKGMKKMTAKEVEAHINPPVTKEQQIAEAEAKKQALISEANQKTQMWQTQLMLGIITEEDKASLKEWMLYVQQVQAVDVSTGQDIIWPVKPAV
ncbi:TPA: tail fiber assembly protein [Escherichia coli]|nr:tail fiber assembly protein [Escherichia coli]HDQ3816557.1 tail fiber assembly protein [Escherichia coli]